MVPHDFRIRFAERVVVALCIATLFAITASHAQIPQTMSYQGALTDVSGTAVPDGNYHITIKLYDVAAGGIHLWEEAQSVAVSKGIFNVVLGSINPLLLPFDKPYWLGVRVASGPELTPRIPLTSSAYSLNALSVADFAVTSLKIADGTVKEIDLANGAVTTSKIAPGSVDGSVLTTSGGSVFWQTPSGGGITLPYSGTTSSPNPAFSVANAGSGNGISGLSYSAVGVRGESSGGIGVAGKSTSGIGVGGQSTSNAGVYGSSTSGNGLGGESSSGFGARGESSSGVGVHGVNTTSGNYAELGKTDFALKAVAFSGHGAEIQSTGGDAVRAFSGGSNKSGVYGVNDKSDGYGVYGRNSFNGNVGYLGGPDGVSGSTNLDIATGVRGVSTAINGIGVWGQADTGPNAWGVHGRSTQGIAVFGSSTNGIAMRCDGKFYQSGGVFEAHPTSTNWTTNKPATVKLNDGSKVKLFAEEATEVYFSDYGEGTLTSGRAHIELDPTFLQTVTVTAQHPMKVFVQLEDDCNGVYVTNKTVTGFKVVELQAGTSNASFTYRVVCKRKHYEDERLATEEQDLQYNQRMLETVWPEVIAKHQADLEKMQARPTEK